MFASEEIQVTEANAKCANCDEPIVKDGEHEFPVDEYTPASYRCKAVDWRQRALAAETALVEADAMDVALVEASYALHRERQRCRCYSLISGPCPTHRKVRDVEKMGNDAITAYRAVRGTK